MAFQPPRSSRGPVEFARVLRREATHAEHRLWALLRSRRLAGWRFRRQQPIGPYIVDFFCAQARLVIEIDGAQHMTLHDYDARRTALLARRGLRVIRFWNNDVLQRTESVLEAILLALEASESGASHP